MVIFLIIWSKWIFVATKNSKLYSKKVQFSSCNLYFCCMHKIFVFWVTNESYKNKKHQKSLYRWKERILMRIGLNNAPYINSLSFMCLFLWEILERRKMEREETKIAPQKQARSRTFLLQTYIKRFPLEMNLQMWFRKKKTRGNCQDLSCLQILKWIKRELNACEIHT